MKHFKISAFKIAFLQTFPAKNKLETKSKLKLGKKDYF